MGKKKTSKKAAMNEPDFKKVKNKVGKKKLLPSSNTDVSFKSRSINMPLQGLNGATTTTGGVDGVVSEPLTHRHNTLKKLLVQIRHYNSNVRRDAVNGIRELLVDHSATLLETNVGDILEGVLSLGNDMDPAVRLSLRSLLNVLLPAVSPERISPFVGLCVAHLCSSLTHISDGIRLDALTLLDLWLSQFPQLLVVHASRLLPNLLDLFSGSRSSSSESAINSGGRSLTVTPAGKISSLQARTSVMIRISDFLDNIYASYKRNCYQEAPWLRGDNDMLITEGECKNNITWDKTQSNACVIFSDRRFIISSQSEATSYDISHLVEFARSVTPVLLECWVECVPADLGLAASTAGGSGRSSIQLACMDVILRVLESLWRLLDLCDRTSPIQFSVNINFSGFHTDFSKYFGARFPFKDDSTTSLNIRICSFISHFLSVAGRNGRYIVETSKFSWTRCIFNYIIGALETRESDKATMDTLLPVVWFLLRQPLVSPDNEDFLTSHKESLIIALHKLFESTGYATENKSMLLDFLTFFHFDQTEYTVEDDNSGLCWVKELPRLMWQWDIRKLGSTRSALRTLNFLSCQNAANPTLLKSLTLAMAPFFHAFVGPKSVFGPFLFLPPQFQMDSLNPLFYWDTLPYSLLRSMARCATSPMLSFMTRSRMIELVYTRLLHSSNSVEWEVGLSFLITVLVGYTIDELEIIGKEKPALFSVKVSERRHYFQHRDSRAIPFINESGIVKDITQQWNNRRSTVDVCVKTIVNLALSRFTSGDYKGDPKLMMCRNLASLFILMRSPALPVDAACAITILIAALSSSSDSSLGLDELSENVVALVIFAVEQKQLSSSVGCEGVEAADMAIQAVERLLISRPDTFHTTIALLQGHIGSVKSELAVLAMATLVGTSSLRSTLEMYVPALREFVLAADKKIGNSTSAVMSSLRFEMITAGFA